MSPHALDSNEPDSVLVRRGERMEKRNQLFPPPKGANLKMFKSKQLRLKKKWTETSHGQFRKQGQSKRTEVLRPQSAPRDHRTAILSLHLAETIAAYLLHGILPSGTPMRLQSVLPKLLKANRTAQA